MNQVNVSINGRRYLLNCGEGEEDKLQMVVSYINEKISQLDKITKQSGDTNLMLAAALLASNEVLEIRSHIQSLTAELEVVKESERTLSQKTTQSETETHEVLAKTITRIESLATMIEAQVENKEDQPDQLQARTA